MFSKKVSRKRDTESFIQKNLFLSLEEKLGDFLEEYGLSKNKNKKAVESFQWEQKLETTVNNFSVFSTNHRPDAVLSLDGIRIGIEIKKGDGGAALRSGLGQCVIYSSEFDFVVYLFVDTTPNENIKKSLKSDREKRIITDLWQNDNVMFDII